jgi:hypothetical protein
MPKGYYNRYKVPKAAIKIEDALKFEALMGRPPFKGEWVKRRLKKFEKQSKENHA